MKSQRILSCVAAASIVLLPSLARGQATTTGVIAGVVRDATGAVLPGVTVEAISPALIEKLRVVVTDERGNYKIVDLRPGVYSVAFTLPGFATLKREGLELSSGFTATVNAELRVGSLEESVIVTGASPIVDVQNARTQQLLTTEVMNALPTGSKSIAQFASITLGAMSSSGARNDVGGDKGELSTGIVLHGGRGDDGRLNFDGMGINVFYGGGGGQQKIYQVNQVAIEEVTIDTSGNSAEIETGGANLNAVPKEGGNTFKVYAMAAYTNDHFSSSAVSSELLTRGALRQASVGRIYDFGLGVGGSLKADRLWFYSASRVWGSHFMGTNNFFNQSVNPFVYVADPSRPAYTDSWTRDLGVRLTWQMAPKHKLTMTEHWQRGCGCWNAIGNGASVSPEAASVFEYGPHWLTQLTWAYPATNKLLVQAGATFLEQVVDFTGKPFPDLNQYSILEQTTGYRFGAQSGGVNNYGKDQDNQNYNQRFSVSYVTGSHAFKTGIQTLQGHYDTTGMQGVNQVNYVFRNGLPISLTQWAGPFRSFGRLSSLGAFAQDQWTMRRLTVNVGVRLDHFEGYTVADTIPAGPFVGARTIPEARDLPNFTDVSPRLGVAYDVFGTGRTALKMSFGRYVAGQGGGLLNSIHPANAIVTNATRTWDDANRNLVPDCTLVVLTANGECGQVNNLRFGQPNVNLTWAEEARTGWGRREYNYQYSVAVQQELRPGFGLSVGYFRTDWRNQLATVNTSVSASDYDHYCVTAPRDTRLPGGGENQICGLYDVKPARFGQIQNVLMLAADVPGANGRPKEVFNGIDVGLSGRFGKGGLLQGGVAVGGTTFDNCWANNAPNALQQFVSASQPRIEEFCHVTSPLWQGVGSQIKLQGVYPLPGAVQLSGTFKTLPGIQQTADYPITNAIAAPALGRNLSAGATATAVVALIPTASNNGNAAGSQFDQRLNQVDVRLSKIVRLAGARLQGMFDVYNLFNNRPAQAINGTYGSRWLQPTVLLGGRLYKFGGQFDW